MEEEKIKSLEKLVGKKIEMLPREKVEGKFLVEQAKNATVALLSGGDALTATTHISLLLDAKKAGVRTRVIHNSSIFTAAAGKAGLQIYKFGKTASIPFPRENYKPGSWFGIVKENIERGAHSLVLLDTEPNPMEAKKALELLIEADGEKLLKGKKITVLSRIGEADEKISCGEIEKLKTMELGKPPFTIIIPGKLHFLEEECLETL
jgi:diphthine synthase